MNLRFDSYLKKIVRLVPILLLPTFLVGCWDSIEINNRSVILEFAIDKNMESQYNPDIPLDDQSIYDITYTIPDMGKLSGTESLATDMETSILVQAPTIAASIDDLETKTRNTISFSHVKGVLVGEDLLKDKILFKQVIDAMARDMLIARNVPLLAVKGRAADIAKIENAQQPVVGLYIMNYFNNKERPKSYFKPQLLGNFIRDIQDTGVGTIPIFHLPEQTKGTTAESEGQIDQAGGEQSGEKTASGPNNEIDISGGAVIKNYEFIDYITKEEVRGQLLIQGEIVASPVTIIYDDSSVTYTIKEEKSKLKFEDTPEGPICHVQITTKGDVSEYSSQNDQDIFDQQLIDEVAVKIQEEIKRQAQIAVDKAKTINTDFLQIGFEMYRHQPKMWKKYAEGWDNGNFQKTQIIIEVESTVENTGILQ